MTTETSDIIEFAEEFDIPSGTAQTRGHGANGRTWKSPSHRRAAAAWQALFERHRPTTPLAGAIHVVAHLFYHRDGVGGCFPRVARPDYDNLAKVFNDALVRAGVIADDACIFHGETWKHDQDLFPEQVTFEIWSESPDKTAKKRTKTRKTDKKQEKQR